MSQARRPQIRVPLLKLVCSCDELSIGQRTKITRVETLLRACSAQTSEVTDDETANP
jgi:hypothetical protein